MERIEGKGWVTLTFDEELQLLREKIEDILATYNPNNPATMDMIQWNIENLIERVNREWQSELVDRGIKDMNETNAMLTDIIFSPEVRDPML